MRNLSAAANRDGRELAESQVESLTNAMQPVAPGELLLVHYPVPDRARRFLDEALPFQVVQVVGAAEEEGRTDEKSEESEEVVDGENVQVVEVVEAAEEEGRTDEKSEESEEVGGEKNVKVVRKEKTGDTKTVQMSADDKIEIYWYQATKCGFADNLPNLLAAIRGVRFKPEFTAATRTTKRARYRGTIERGSVQLRRVKLNENGAFSKKLVADVDEKGPATSTVAEVLKLVEKGLIKPNPDTDAEARTKVNDQQSSGKKYSRLADAQASMERHTLGSGRNFRGPDKKLVMSEKQLEDDRLRREAKKLAKDQKARDMDRELEQLRARDAKNRRTGKTREERKGDSPASSTDSDSDAGCSADDPPWDESSDEDEKEEKPKKRSRGVGKGGEAKSKKRGRGDGKGGEAKSTKRSRGDGKGGEAKSTKRSRGDGKGGEAKSTKRRAGRGGAAAKAKKRSGGR